jgi:ActR/RegA family two-component response regulator
METITDECIEKQFVIIEDDKDFADKCVKKLELEKDVNLKIVNSKEQILHLIENQPIINRVYVVDIHLGYNKENLGFEIIRLIRSKEKHSLIVVHSAHPNFEEKAINSGADVFFPKDATREIYELNFAQLKNLIKRQFVNDNIMHKQNQLCLLDKWDNITKIPAKVYDIEDDFITLNCMIDIERQIIVKKTFPKTIFKEFDNIEIDKSILVTIKERPKKMCYMFDDENVDDIDKAFFDESNNINDLQIFNK